MKPWYTEYAETFGAQLVVNGQPIATRAAVQLTGLSNGAVGPFLNWFLGEHHRHLLANRRPGDLQGRWYG